MLFFDRKFIMYLALFNTFFFDLLVIFEKNGSEIIKITTFKYPWFRQNYETWYGLTLI